MTSVPLSGQHDAASLDLRCSVLTRGQGERPAGSATSSDHFLLVELPLPWPASIDTHPVIEALALSSEVAASVRILGIRPPEARIPASRRNHHHVISYRHTPGTPFDGYRRSETSVSTDELIPALRAITSGDRSRLDTVDNGIRDLLVCTHGTRDRCCGQMGSLLVTEVADLLDENIRVWRTSHTGGHRFAPTAITFPDGMTWSYLDARLVSGILDRSIAPADLVGHTRGCAGVPSRHLQVADAAAFARVGWSWLEQPRNAVLVEQDDSSDRYEIHLTGAARQFTVTMTSDEAVSVPVCGEPLAVAVKSSRQFTITSISEG